MAENLPPNSVKDELEDEENTVTMVDVLKAEEILEENADAVLGPGDDKNCTYAEGYVKRQALYSCLTCLPANGTDCAGVCLACSYHCHSDHDLIELYTKRKFRCDCGNSLFKGRKCTLDSVKSKRNEGNRYNQNFSGVYCSCSRPYPDPEDPVEDEMIQCIVCEDWFHSRHLGSSVPHGDDYSEMVCGPCSDRLPFLRYYLGHAVNKVSSTEGKNDSAVDIDVTDDNILQNSPQKQVVVNGSSGGKILDDQPETKDSAQEPKTTPESCHEVIGNKDGSHASDTKENVPKNKPVHVDATSNQPTSNKTSENDKTENITKALPEIESNEMESKEKGCLLKGLKMLPKESGATFWPDGFRKLLCTCISCLDVYKSLGVEYLCDETDTVSAYEAEGRRGKAHTQYEQGMAALSSLDRVQQVEAIMGYNEMKTHLSEYLSKFVQNKKVVREEDIREFFSGMQARKRQKVDIPYNCR